jgi:hypothetical protein
MNRMALSNVLKGKQENPVRFLVYGPEGVGKSTFASNAPSPIFLSTEKGTDFLDVARFPEIHAWEEAQEALRILAKEKHDYKTIVIDTVDSLEQILFAHIASTNGVRSVYDVGGGFGRGEKAAAEEWRRYISLLEQLFEQKKMNIIFLAHTTIKTQRNPSGADYDKFVIAIHESASSMMRRWVDLILFATFDMAVAKTKDTGPRPRATSSGARVVYTRHEGGSQGKNRYDLPARMPLDFSEVWDAIHEKTDGQETELRAQIAARMTFVTDKAKLETIAKYLEKKLSVDRLRQVLNRIETMIVPEEPAADAAAADAPAPNGGAT